jgi:hypothetical protein
LRRENKDMPEILGRLRNHSSEQLDEPTAPRWAAPAGWIITLGLVGVVVYVLLRANPL